MTSIELFGCSGGMAEGFRRAGIVFDFAFDKDADACASYERNLGHRPIRMDVRDMLRLVREGWAPFADLLVADPPCTPWSRAGKREGLDDERDMLAETAELIGLLRPRAYLIGNVPGLQDATSWHVVQDVIGGLQRHGYCVRDYAQLDAADYGVPQHRIRPFWYGHLGGPCIRWPHPTHCDPAQPPLPGVADWRPWVTCREALGHLPVEDLGRPVRVRNGHSTRHGRNWDDHPPSEVDAPARVIGARDRTNSGTVMRLPDPNRPPAQPDAPHRAVSTARDQALLAWPWDRPSTTVTCRAGLPPPGHHPESGSIMTQPNAVVLSERAAALLQGFPPGWHFAGATKKARWSQIGQAMPPPLAEAVARAVRQALTGET